MLILGLFCCVLILVLLLFALWQRENLDIVAVVGFNAVVNIYLYHACKWGDFCNLTNTVLRFNGGVNRRSHADFLLVAFVLESQAAHKSAASTGDFCGVKGEVLLFCHFNGNLAKIG